MPQKSSRKRSYAGLWVACDALSPMSPDVKGDFGQRATEIGMCSTCRPAPWACRSRGRCTVSTQTRTKERLKGKQPSTSRRESWSPPPRRRIHLRSSCPSWIVWPSLDSPTYPWISPITLFPSSSDLVNYRLPLKMSFLRKQESRTSCIYWTPACAGVTN